NDASASADAQPSKWIWTFIAVVVLVLVAFASWAFLHTHTPNEKPSSVVVGVDEGRPDLALPNKKPEEMALRKDNFDVNHPQDANNDNQPKLPPAVKPAEIKKPPAPVDPQKPKVGADQPRTIEFFQGGEIPAHANDVTALAWSPDGRDV